MDLNEQVSKKIKDLRKENGWSQEYLANLLIMERSTYSKLEQGEKDFTLTILEKLSKIFKIELYKLLDLDKTEFNIVSNNNGTLSAQGINTTLSINIPPELIEQIIDKLDIKK